MKIDRNLTYTEQFILGFLSNLVKIRESLYFGSIDQLDTLLDIDILLKETKLTIKQQKVLNLYFFNQYTQSETAKILNISQQAVFEHLNIIKNKIRKTLEKWNEINVK